MASTDIVPMLIDLFSYFPEHFLYTFLSNQATSSEASTRWSESYNLPYLVAILVTLINWDNLHGTLNMSYYIKFPLAFGLFSGHKKVIFHLFKLIYNLHHHKQYKQKQRHFKSTILRIYFRFTPKFTLKMYNSCMLCILTEQTSQTWSIMINMWLMHHFTGRHLLTGFLRMLCFYKVLDSKVWFHLPLSSARDCAGFLSVLGTSGFNAKNWNIVH